MKSAGRANWIMVTLLGIVVAMVVLIFLGGQSPTAAAKEFMIALSSRDIDKLAEMSYFDPPRPIEDIKAAWKRTTDYGKYYKFAWIVKHSKSPQTDRASVTMDLTKDSNKPTAYSEAFPIELVKVAGKWKVDVKSLSRPMYPALPR